MTINPQYMIAPSLQEYFVDVNSGEPLNAGVIYFWVDTAHNVAKQIYTLTGNPPDYTYSSLGASVTLNASGTFSDNDGNDILPYYYPYDAEGNVQLYFIEVYSAGGIETGTFQFSRQAFPNFESGSEITTNLINYVENPQFLLHNDIQDDGLIVDPITYIAPGGWTFEVPDSTTSINYVTFSRYGSATLNPTGNPRYAVDINCTVPSGSDALKDLALRFENVNMFASEDAFMTFSATMQSQGAGSFSVELIFIRNFGTGGSATTETVLTTFEVDTSEAIYTFAFQPGDNVGKTIGSLDDDYLKIVLRPPLAFASNLTVTDVLLTDGDITIDSFPNTTKEDTVNRSMGGGLPIPAYDGSDNYLPIISTPTGFNFDSSTIGEVVSETQVSIYSGNYHPTTNKLLANGAQYSSTAYSPLGIPLSRLFNIYYNSTLHIPIWGTGLNFFTCVYPGSANEIRIVNNTLGSVTAAADGAITTGFTFSTIHTGGNSYTSAFLSSSPTPLVYLKNNQAGGASDATAQTSGFTIVIIKDTISTGGSYNASATTTSLTSIACTSSTGLGGKYFNFDSINSGSDQKFYLWFKVAGVGADPAPATRTGILLNLDTGDSATIVAQKVMEALNGFQQTTILTTTGGSITAGSYFTISSTTTNYYVWYKVNAVGTDPAPVGKTGILVSVLSTDTNAQVASKTQIAINQTNFAVPNLQDVFLRGWNSTTDNFLDRLSIIPGISGNLIGTIQQDSIYSHFHTPISPTNIFLTHGTGSYSGAEGTTDTDNSATQVTGGLETRPINMAINFAIRY